MWVGFYGFGRFQSPKSTYTRPNRLWCTSKTVTMAISGKIDFSDVAFFKFWARCFRALYWVFDVVRIAYGWVLRSSECFRARTRLSRPQIDSGAPPNLWLWRFGANIDFSDMAFSQVLRTVFSSIVWGIWWYWYGVWVGFGGFLRF